MIKTEVLKSVIEKYIVDSCISENNKEKTLKMLLNKLSELERLAEIGRATEKAFEIKGFIVLQTEEVDEYQEIETVKNLLNWAKED